MTPLWRKTFDAIERPLAAGSEAWIQSETFMDLATHSVRIQRRMLHEVQNATERWLHLFGYEFFQSIFDCAHTEERHARIIHNQRDCAAYLFRPQEVRPFFEACGFRTELLVASQGFLAPVQERVAELRERDEAAYAALLDLAVDTAGDPSVHGLSGHLLYVGSAP